MILDGSLEPGSRLRETDFSQRLGIARHTFRAATQILINVGVPSVVEPKGLANAPLPALEARADTPPDTPATGPSAPTAGR